MIFVLYDFVFLHHETNKKHKAMSKPKFKQYERVSPIETPNIITKVDACISYRRGLKRERYYRLTNGQFLSEDELQKAES